MNRASTLLLAFVASYASGCAVGRKHAYDLATPQLQQRGNVWVALAVADQREGVTSGRKSPAFVGLSRGGWGNTFDILTKSGLPLAAEFSGALARGLAAGGYRVTTVATAPGTPPPALAAALARTGATVGLLVQLAEWKSDTYNSTALIYDVSIQVIDAGGRVLGQAAIRGHDNLGGSFWNPPAHAEAVIPGAFRGKLEALLNAPQIAGSLRAAAAPMAPPTAPPAALSASPPAS
jgi:hypothetical protein